MKTTKLLSFSLAASVAGVAVAEMTGARALFISGETFFATIAGVGIGVIALRDLFRNRKTSQSRAGIVRPTVAARPTAPYFTRHSQVNNCCKAA
jgi:hypothetical protein